MADSELPECRPEEVEISVEWQDADGGLTGWVEVRNVGTAARRLSGKPALLPLSPEGAPVGVSTVVTAELRLPGYVVLGPGSRARSRTRWPAWRGPAPGDEILVRWPGGEKQVRDAGPSAPARSEGPQNISSSWFELVPD